MSPSLQSQKNQQTCFHLNSWMHLYVFPIQCASIWPCPRPTKPLLYQLIFATTQKLGRCRSPTRPTEHRKLTFPAPPLPRFSSPPIDPTMNYQVTSGFRFPSIIKPKDHQQRQEGQDKYKPHWPPAGSQLLDPTFYF